MSCPQRIFSQTVDIYYTSCQITRHETCFAYMFTNIGDTPATVNGMVIYPGVPGASLGDSRTISGHIGDLYGGRITLTFDAAAMGATPAVEIVQTYYI